MSSPSVVIAIDFGTARSGYAYSFASNHRDVCSPPLMNGGTTSKTRTCILLERSPPHRCIAFGDEAYQKYLTSKANSAQLYFDRFKMNLNIQPGEKNKPKVMAEGKGKQELDAVIVIGAVLKFISEKASAEIMKANVSSVSSATIKWIITVPAIWNNSAKSLMREAGERAGLKDFSFALEPEGASLRCWDQVGRDQQIPGSKVFVVDCGGGTVDTVVHEIKHDLSVSEVISADGGPWGSTFIDAEFRDLLGRLFNRSTFNDWKTNNGEDFIDLMKDWESIKSTFGNGDDSALLGLPYSLHQYLEGVPTTLDNLIKAYNNGGGVGLFSHHTSTRPQIQNFKGKLELSYQVIESLFSSCVKNILEHIEKTLKRVPSIKYLFLVGGFADSPYLRKRVEESVLLVNRTTRVVCPPNASSAVVTGAVMWGWNPSIISERRSRFTYGTDCLRPYTAEDEMAGRPVCWKNMDGKHIKYCERFSVFVKKDSPVKVGSVVKKDFNPFAADQPNMGFAILQSSNSEVSYVNDSSVQTMGNISIDIPKEFRRLDHSVDVEFAFGATEIHITVFDPKSRNKKDVKIQFFGED